MAEPGRGGGAPGLVACQLTLAAAAARPGETVTALLQVSCSQPEAVELQEVEIEFSGIERIDTSWVLPSYRRTAPPINDDKRKVQRYVVQSRLQAATQGTFSDLSLRRFVVRFMLPAWLPPTFRGTAVRYLYYLQAMVKYRPAHQPAHDGGDGRSNGVGPAAAAASAGTGVATRIPLHIWPSKAEAAGERGPSLLPGAGVGAPLQSEDMPIKCWEIGPGTAVQDAVAHIAKLAGQAAPSRPHSPGGRLLRGATAAAPQRAPGPVGGDDGGEISHGAAQGEAVARGEAEPLLPPPPLRVLPKQPPESVPQPTPASSGASTPHSRLSGRRAPQARASLDQALAPPRSPSQVAADSGSALRSFALRIGDQPLVRVSLHPPLEGSLQPGSTLAGTLDFTPQPPQQATPADGSVAPAAAAPPGPCCVQVLILLETEEVVEAAWRRPVQGGGGGAIRRVYDEQLEVTADTAVTHFLFSIPPDAAASFQTPLVQLRWLLRFQFTAAAPPPAPAGGAPPPDRSPLQGRLEQLTWALPVTVLPPAS